jgi:diguanylate cyclase (GGDEF)-like protein
MQQTMGASGADTDEKFSQPLAEANDPITGLSFRGQFLKCVADVLASPPGQRGAFAMVAIGLDQFARITDTFGHAVGLTLLLRVAERLRRSLQPVDQIARMGENEFAVLLFASEERALVMVSQFPNGRLGAQTAEFARGSPSLES